MTDTIRYCANQCSRVNNDGNREPVHAKIGNICGNCMTRLEKWLREIPDRYAEVPTYLEPTTDLDRNPEVKNGRKRATAPAPIRLAALDLLDTRRGRRWQGLVPTESRRGALGTLMEIGNELRAMRGVRPVLNATVSGEAEYIRGGLDRLAFSAGIDDTYKELKALHRQLGDAIGDYPAKPVSTCPEEYDDGVCGGPILPNAAGGVYCPRCGTRWDVERLRWLGRMLAEGETA